MNQYSPLFHTLHDEREPIGSLGRGTHYSVLRCISRRVPEFPNRHEDNVIAMAFAYGARGALPVAKPDDHVHDFAVIWDEDHDTRVIRIAEQLASADMLKHVLVIGESKGVVSVLVKKDRGAACIHAFWSYFNKVAYTTDFTFAMDEYTGASSRVLTLLINDDPRRVRRYLDGILALWSIGCER